MQQQAMTTLNKAFDDVYAIGASDPRAVFGNAAVKGEGQPVDYDHNTMTYKAVNRYSLNATQLELCKRVGMDPGEYARQLEKHGT
jgi:hypothetical protein